MAIQRKDRLVSFRLTNEEYATLADLARQEGAGTLSSFVRKRLLEQLNGRGGCLTDHFNVTDLAAGGMGASSFYEQLSAKLEYFGSEIERLVRLCKINT